MFPDTEAIRRGQLAILAALTVVMAISFAGPVTAAGSCGNGHVKAQAYIDESALSMTGFSTAGVLKDFNCAGGAIKANKASGGTYLIKIPGITTGSGGASKVVATASTTGTTTTTFVALYENSSESQITAYVHDYNGNSASADFSIVVFST